MKAGMKNKYIFLQRRVHLKQTLIQYLENETLTMDEYKIIVHFLVEES